MSLLRKRSLLFLLLLSLLFPYVVLLGDEHVYVTVTNQTQYYLHIIINGESFLYVAPQRTVRLNAEGEHSAFMEAFYSPGQGITGSVSQTVDIPTFVVTCESGSCSEGTGSEATNPIVWIITPDLLQGESPE